jgi:hypothetical protein
MACGIVTCVERMHPGMALSLVKIACKKASLVSIFLPPSLFLPFLFTFFKH